MKAPIVIFAFNRVAPLKKLIESLMKCPESKESDLYIFVDGARNQHEEIDVKAVRDYVLSIEGFGNISHSFSDCNKGLGPSIIAGVSNVISNYGRAIVLEDDLEVHPNFLEYMNIGLERYADEEKVFSVCGYSNKIKIKDSYPYDAYFSTRSSSWGWATWADRWKSVDWELKPWNNYRKYRYAFNKWGGSDCFGMLEGWNKGKNKSWAIRFCFSQFLQDKLSLFPIKSLVENNGFDGNGTNCKKWSRFKHELLDETQVIENLPKLIEIDENLQKQALAYNSVLARIVSRIMYIIYR